MPATETPKPAPGVSSHTPETAATGLQALADSVKTCILATVDGQPAPDASYAPCAIDDDGNILVYISTLAKHTGNLRRSGQASVMLIEDEAAAASLYARKRVTWSCRVEVVERGSEAFANGIAKLKERFGGIVDGLASMQDFYLFRLHPGKGRLVLGFGAAFSLEGWQVEGQMHGKHKPSKS